MDTLRVEMGSRGEAFVISLFGELDIAAGSVFSHWRTEIDGARSVEADLSGLTFIDSTGLRDLLHLKHEVESTGRTLILRCPSDSPVRRILSLTGLSDAFTLVDG